MYHYNVSFAQRKQTHRNYALSNQTMRQAKQLSLHNFCYGKYGILPMPPFSQSTILNVAKGMLPQPTAWSGTCMPSSSVSPIARSLHLTSR